MVGIFLYAVDTCWFFANGYPGGISLAFLTYCVLYDEDRV